MSSMDIKPISYQSFLALDYQSLQHPPSAEEIKLANQANLECLKQAILLDELANIHIDDDNLDPADHTKTEKKLDLLINLVSALVEKQRQSDELTEVKLTVDMLEWECAYVDTPGLLSMQIYIHKRSMSPMQFYCDPVQTRENTCQAHFMYMARNVRELLEKYIFLLHRRDIAQQKKHKHY